MSLLGLRRRETLAGINPGLIYCRVSGYSLTGPDEILLSLGYTQGQIELLKAQGLV